MTLCTRMEYYVYKKLCTAQFQLKTALNTQEVQFSTNYMTSRVHLVRYSNHARCEPRGTNTVYKQLYWWS